MGRLVLHWVRYVAYLLAAVGFYIVYEQWISFYLLLAVLLFPLFSLAVSLPAMLGTELMLETEPEWLLRGEVCTVSLTASPGGRILPLRRSECLLRRENLLTGERKVSSPVFRGVSISQVWRESFPAEHCGLLSFRAERAVVYDLSGLFFRRVPPPTPVVRMVSPLDCPPDPLPAFPNGTEGHGAPLSLRGGGEDYELREYRAGDALRSIHWKLSAKAEEPVVREIQPPRKPRFVLSFDLRGTDAELDATFDQLVWLSRRMLLNGHSHRLCWLDPETGLPEERAVEDETALWDCVLLLFSAPVPKHQDTDGPSRSLSPWGERPDWHYHVLPQNRASQKDGDPE